MIWDPDGELIDRSLVKCQAILARLEEASHAASTKQEGFDWIPDTCRRPEDRGITWFLFDWSVRWAWSHSSAAESPFVAISRGWAVLSSKISLFLAVHSDQQIHRSTGVLMPVGRRQMALRNWTSLSALVSACAVIFPSSSSPFVTLVVRVVVWFSRTSKLIRLIYGDIYWISPVILWHGSGSG